MIQVVTKTNIKFTTAKDTPALAVRKRQSNASFRLSAVRFSVSTAKGIKAIRQPRGLDTIHNRRAKNVRNYQQARHHTQPRGSAKPNPQGLLKERTRIPNGNLVG